MTAAPAAYRLVDPSGRSRPWVTGALLASSALLAAAARNPTPTALGRSAAVNSAWVLTCLAVLPRQPRGVGRSLVVATAGLDAAMGGLQWYLRRVSG
ncbi:hypothetical protein [Kineosporia sp. NBRC 101677]|uniref:hypothetical protein n=1 Tax=Kineosporia sp. NBRC 101677 TaxID=3032197 RepID=UPI002557A5B5|nr:hypothetical protein [Kineosporia sp. NBRC 101677]